MGPLEIYGGAGVTSFSVSVLTLLYWNSRLTKVEDGKQDKTMCQVMHDFQKQTNEDRKRDVDKIETKLDYIMERIDSIHKSVNGGSK